MKRRIVGLVSSLAVALPVTVAAWPAAATGHVAADFTAYHGTTPYVPMFTEKVDCPTIKSINQMDAAQQATELANLASWYVHVHSEGANDIPMGTSCQGTSSTTFASKLAALGLMVSNYRNGTYVSQSNTGDVNFGEAADLETSAPLEIGTFWPGQYQPKQSLASTIATLPAAVTDTTSTITVNGSGNARPANAPTTWPYVPSRGTGLNAGAHSTDTHNFVSWIRIDDEIMQVTSVTMAGSTVQLSVRRGLWGTTAVSHAAGAKAFSPAYGGGTGGTAINGSPTADSVSIGLRYEVKIWQPKGWRWLAKRIKTSFGPNLGGHNAVWLDITGCGQANTTDASGKDVMPWHDEANEVFDNANWESAQITKLAGLRTALPGVKMLANSLGGTGGMNCTNDLLAHYVDGGVFENWLMPKTDGSISTWSDRMAQSIEVQQQNWPAIYWVRFDHSSNASRYLRMAYGSMLLTRLATATRPQFGGPFGLAKPDDLFFWNLGVPVGTPSSVSALQVSSGLYRRDFAHGMVLVNTGGSAASYSVGAGYYDLLHQDAAGNPTATSTVTVPAHDAEFLLAP